MFSRILQFTNFDHENTRDMKEVIKNILKPIVFIGFPFTYISALWLKFVRRMDMGAINDKIFMKLGILPVLDHYYQPMINPKKYLKKSLRDDRELPGIDFNINAQLKLLAQLDHSEELLKFPLEKKSDTEFYYNNGFYGRGDAEYLYSFVRHFKPGRIIEIGSGFSTLMVRNAIKMNKADDAVYACKHICIEPYEQPWLEKVEVELIREKVENMDKLFFKTLQKNDILFIDSSHIIRPQGDVLFEYLEILPTLNSGVLVHIHDIFTPKDYLDEWIYEAHSFWNEQYLLEAFMTFNSEFEIIGSLNYLTNNYREEFAAKCPVFAKHKGTEPGAFWLRRK